MRCDPVPVDSSKSALRTNVYCAAFHPLQGSKAMSLLAASKALFLLLTAQNTATTVVTNGS